MGIIVLKGMCAVLKKRFDIKYYELCQTKEYKIEGRYNWRGPPYYMIIHALQTVLHLYKKYLSDVQLPRIQ